MRPYRAQRAEARVPPRTSTWRLFWALVRGTYRRLAVREYYYRAIRPYYAEGEIPRAKMRGWAEIDVRRGRADNAIAVLIMVASTLVSIWFHGDRR